MSKAIERIEKYLNETQYRGTYEDDEYIDDTEDVSYDSDANYEEDEEEGITSDSELLNAMVDFLMTLDPDKLDDEQFEMYMEIMDQFDDEEDDEEEIDDDELVGMDEAAIRKKRDKAARRENKKKYRTKKVKIKQAAKIWRRSAEYKKYQRKKKMMAKQNRTARGKRVKQFVG